MRKKNAEEHQANKFDTGSSLSDNGKTSLLGKPQEKSDKSQFNKTEMTIVKAQNHRYIDIFNLTNAIYDDLRQNFVVLQSEQQKRIIPKFEDDENKIIDRKIKELVIEMTRKVKQAEDNINQLTKIKLSTMSEQEIKENMKLNLATKIKEFSKDFRINEEKYMRNYQELVGDTTYYQIGQIEDLDGSSKNLASNNNGKTSHNGFLQEQVKPNLVLQKRDEEISTLLTSITELASVFKDMQTLVQHQGTILDRIDYNIDSALDNVQHAHKDLVKTEKMMKNNCYRNAMLVVIVWIFVMAILFILKFTS